MQFLGGFAERPDEFDSIVFNCIKYPRFRKPVANFVFKACNLADIGN